MSLFTPLSGLLVALVGPPAGQNLVANPGFEEGLARWTTGHTWYAAGGPGKGNGISAWEVDEGIFHAGRRSARVQGKSNRGIIMQVLRRYPDRYRLSGWIRTEGLDAGKAFLLAEYKARDGQYLGGTPVGEVRGTTDWTPVSGEIVAPPGTHTISIDLLTSDPNTGTAWFDDIALEDLTTDTTPPAPVRSRPAPASAGEIALRWDPETLEQDVVACELYVAEKPFRTIRGMRPLASADPEAGQVSAAGLKKNGAYYARVVAVDQDSNRLNEGEPTMIVTKDTRPPRALTVEAFPVLAHGGAALVRWQPSRLDEDLAGFTVSAGGKRLAAPASARKLLVTATGVGAIEASVAARDAAGNQGPAAHCRVQIADCRLAKGAPGIGGVVTAGGKPLAGATVTAVDAQGRVRQAKTDAQGRYALALLPAKAAAALFRVTAQAPGWHASIGQWVLARPGEALALDLTLDVPAERLAAWSVSSLANVFPDSPPAPRPASPSVAWLAVRGETEGAQVVLRADTPFSIEGVEFDPLTREAASGPVPRPPSPVPTLRVAVVGTLHVNKNSTATPKELLLRQAPADFPDPFLEGWPQPVPAGVSRPIYLMVDVPRAAAPGRYRGTARLRVALEDGARAQVVVPLSLEVAPVTLPAKPTVPVTHWFNTGALCQWHKVEMWSEPFWDILRVYARDMGEHRQTVAMIPLDTVQAFSDGNGITYDFSRFDRWVDLFTREGVGQRLEIMHFGGREHGQWEDKTFILHARSATDTRSGERVPVAPADFAAAIERHLVEKGWLERATLHIADEPIPMNVASWREISRVVRGGARTVKRIDAIHVPPEEVTGDLEVMVPQLNYFDQWHDAFLEAQAKGAEVWFYIAWVPQGKYPNRLIDYPAIKTRIIPWMIHALKATGYLHWGLNFWTKDLADTGFAPGDNWIVYPGSDGPRSSLRWEAFRDGLEDCELFRLLVRKDPKLADALMREAVRSATDYETDPARLEAVRRKVIRALSE